MTTLAMGANAPVSSPDFTLNVHVPPGAEVDVTALQLYADGKVRGDGDMCFYNQTSIAAGAISLTSGKNTQSFLFHLDKLSGEVEKIVVNATLDGGAFSSIGSLDVTTTAGIDMLVETTGRAEAALILCEIYKRNDQWKIRNVSQGFNGGLKALAEHFGVEVAVSDSPAPAATAPAPVRAASAPVDLDKISLTKKESVISLKKDDALFGRIRINLNWNQKPSSGGFLGMGKRGIDLDLGAFVEINTGELGVVQALGNSFGDLDQPPFIKLLADDRTGTSIDGEWLEINGDAWSSIRRILIFAFIYEGAANWRETDGVIQLMVPGQPEVEVRMNEQNTNKRDIMCAVARIENSDNQIRVSREVRFFTGHEQMDKEYGWGMGWSAGTK
ncbi:MAG: TerD family protein [Granulosicoccus sp.]